MFGVLGVVTLIRIPVLIVSGVLTSKKFTIHFMYCLFLIVIYLGKKVYLIVDAFSKKVILVFLFVSRPTNIQ
jgi:hypothetical protein